MRASYQPENMLRTSPEQTLSSKVNAEVGAVLAGQTGRAQRGATHLTADAPAGLTQATSRPGATGSLSPRSAPASSRSLIKCASYSRVRTHALVHPALRAQLPRPSSGRAEPHRAVEQTQVFRVRAHSGHRGSKGKMLLGIFGRDPRRE